MAETTSVSGIFTYRYNILASLGRKISKKYKDSLRDRVSLIAGFVSFGLAIPINFMPQPLSWIFSVIVGLFGLVMMPIFSKYDNP